MTDSYRIRITDWTSDEQPLRAVRHAVFCLEQRIPEELEWDDADRSIPHALAEDEAGQAIGCGRLLPDGHIGRMAVLASWRGKGVGAALLQALIDLGKRRGHAVLRLNAQTHAMPFYARFGFAPVGAPFDEAGIPHQAMERAL
jgi:predicted GNAT family N-acyltransferase